MLGGMMQSIGVGGTVEASELNFDDQLYIDTVNNRVGIGTSSPGYKLEIYDASATVIAGIHSNGGHAYLRIDAHTASGSFVDYYRSGSRLFHTGLSDTADNYEIRDDSSNKLLVIESTGNVGIGTTVPSAALDVQTANDPQAIFTRTGSGNSVSIKQSNSDSMVEYSINGGSSWITGIDNSNGDAYTISQTGGFFGTNDYVTIAITGNVGIGTASPSAKLHVNGDVIFDQGSELTISAGVIIPTHAFHAVDTESDASTDDLDTINGASTGKMLILRAADNNRTIVLKDGVDNLRLAGDFPMTTGNDMITLIGLGTNWFEISRSDNA